MQFYGDEMLFCDTSYWLACAGNKLTAAWYQIADDETAEPGGDQRSTTF